jgi:hypothetical protein
MQFMETTGKLRTSNWYRRLFGEAFKKGNISYFEFEMFEKLREFYCAGCPLDILIGSLKLSNKKCYDRAMQLTFIFDDCVLVHGNLKRYAKVNGEKDFYHAWVEVNNFVYDTTWGMKFEKEFYYEFMGVEIHKKETTYEMQKNEWYMEQKNSKLKDQLIFVDMVIPMLRGVLESELIMHQLQNDQYYIILTQNLIDHCDEILAMSEVKEFIRGR